MPTSRASAPGANDAMLPQVGAVASGTVLGVHLNPAHGFSKPAVDEIELVEGVGVRGDAHAGVTVTHRHLVRKDPSKPNLRQVHLIHAELFDQLREQGHEVAPGELGENITTAGLDLLGLPVGTRLGFGDAVVTITGLRDPCSQINDFQPGLMKKLIFRDGQGEVVRLCGVMGIVSRGGVVRPGDAISVQLPEGVHHRLTTV